MDETLLHQLLNSVARGQTPVADAMARLRHLAVEDIGCAQIDHHRSLRKGFPEVIFGQGKTGEQIVGIMTRMIEQERVVLATRVEAHKADYITSRIEGARYHPDARMVVWSKGEIAVRGKGTILVLCAGTSDIPVAKEAYLTARAMGNPVEQIYDVGVAGIHRLFRYRRQVESASVLIVVAGMEGALPSVVAGMVGRPVIAVPTSVGYGASMGGLTALFAMLNSCSSNVAVVNIDNGFGAGYFAATINQPRQSSL
jgi:NCAIR mutase (PurE)-related protein